MRTGRVADDEHLSDRGENVIRLIYADGPEVLDGIRLYAERCVEAIREHCDRPAELELWRRNRAVGNYSGDLIVLQYNPFSYGRRGFAPWLVRRVRALRRSACPSAIALVVHEAFVPPRSARWVLMGAWQRVQLAALGRWCDAIVVSSEAWRESVRRLVPKVPIHHVPVGSNLPDRREQREQTRARHGWERDAIVIGALGADSAARLEGYVVSALNALAVTHENVVFANLGSAALDDAGLDPRVVRYRPGFQAETDLASDLAAIDVFVAPFEDGVSARRTTLVAALQHGLAVVGTRGRNTDAYLAGDRRLALTDVGVPDQFAQRVVDAATNADVRDKLREGARALYIERFDWVEIAKTLLTAIDDA